MPVLPFLLPGRAKLPQSGWGVLIALAVLAPIASAQSSPVSNAVLPGEPNLSTGYESLLREYRSFKPVPQRPTRSRRSAAVQAADQPDSVAASEVSSQEVAEAIAAALSTREETPDGVQRLEIDGLVVDQTITRNGREFYTAFYSQWRPPPEAVSFTITITEQPAPGTNTVIRVDVNDEVVYQSRLQLRADEIGEDAARAISYTYRRLQRGSGPPPVY